MLLWDGLANIIQASLDVARELECKLVEFGARLAQFEAAPEVFNFSGYVLNMKCHLLIETTLNSRMASKGHRKHLHREEREIIDICISSLAQCKRTMNSS